MAGAPIPENEHARLLDLAQYDILDTASDPALQRVTRLAAHLLQVPIALVNFVDRHRQWGTALVGVESTEAPREHSFCAWAIVDERPLLVPDARLDPRFENNPMVTGEPGIRMYAGAPLQTPAGQRIGTLCVVDRVPRTLGAADLQALQDLAALAVDALELRRLQREEAGRHPTPTEAPGSWQEPHAQVLGTIEGELQEQPTLHGARRAAGLLHEAVAADWSGVVGFSDGGVRVQTAHARAGLRLAPERLENHLGAAADASAPPLSALHRPLYQDTYALHPEAAPFVPDLGTRVQSAAWLPLWSGPQGSALMVFLRLAGPAERSWSGPDRALLEAAARLIGHALQRREEPFAPVPW